MSDILSDVVMGIIALLLLAILILGIILGVAVIRDLNAPAPPQEAPVSEAPAPEEPTAQSVQDPSWVESYTVSPESDNNFRVSLGDWTVVTNDLYTMGNRTQDVTIVIENISSEIVVVNYSGNNWSRGLQINPGEDQVFTGKVGDFRVTLLSYENE